VTIQKAVDRCKATGRQLFLFAGLYNLGAVRDCGDGGPKTAICIRNMHREFAFVGELRSVQMRACGTAERRSYYPQYM